MKITVNGVDRNASEGATLAAVVAAVSDAGGGIAVALNGEVVRRADWMSTTVREADRIEVLTAVQGG